MYSNVVDCLSETGQIPENYSIYKHAMNETYSGLDQVTQVIGYHPVYLEHFLRSQKFIMEGDGPLPYDYRNYLAIMAAARHQCTYLVRMYEQLFLRHNGNPEWLKGLEYIPAKLRAIYHINKVLAHRPWLLRAQDIAALTKGQHSWSLSEVVHAMVILSHFHALSSFVFSCGLTQKLSNTATPTKSTNNGPVDQANRQQPQQQQHIQWHQQQQEQIAIAIAAAQQEAKNKDGAQDHSAVIAGVEATMERMRELSENHQSSWSETELSNSFKNIEEQTAELVASSAISSTMLPPSLSHYINDPSFTYEDFTRRGVENTHPTFRVQDYSWQDHGYALVEDLYTDVGPLLDKKFHNAYNLTYFTMGRNKNVDTSQFRRAIWNYIQCVYGIRHDDYNYGEINQLLDRPFKTFIKMACCFPERITTKDYDNILRELQDSEKVHVNLMIMEARNQAELLYALREIMRYMT